MVVATYCQEGEMGGFCSMGISFVRWKNSKELLYNENIVNTTLKYTNCTLKNT